MSFQILQSDKHIQPNCNYTVKHLMLHEHTYLTLLDLLYNVLGFQTVRL